MKRFCTALVFVAGLAFGGSGCIIVDDDDGCYEGDQDCADGEHIEECIHGRWRIVEHCEYECGGFCDYDYDDYPACFCPE